MYLKVGGVYKTREGVQVNIVGRCGDPIFPYVGVTPEGNSYIYTSSGSFSNLSKHYLDLVSEIQPPLRNTRTTMQLKVGGTYATLSGKQVTILSDKGEGFLYPCVGKSDNSARLTAYTRCGLFTHIESSDEDLVREVLRVATPSTTPLTDLAKAVHQNAVDHGWHDVPRSFGDVIALCHSELSEALEEHRCAKPAHYVDEGKPEGVAVEMIDCIIRILDYAGLMGWDVDALIQEKHEYNKSRPYRHGGKQL